MCWQIWWSTAKFSSPHSAKPKFQQEKQYTFFICFTFNNSPVKSNWQSKVSFADHNFLGFRSPLEKCSLRAEIIHYAFMLMGWVGILQSSMVFSLTFGAQITGKILLIENTKLSARAHYSILCKWASEY